MFNFLYSFYFYIKLNPYKYLFISSFFLLWNKIFFFFFSAFEEGITFFPELESFLFM